jgi:archaellum biogenesis protein FlaJ (TadC family)
MNGTCHHTNGGLTKKDLKYNKHGRIVSRKKSLNKEINQELPFMTIYMAAIATSGIEPSKIFDILVSFP